MNESVPPRRGTHIHQMVEKTQPGMTDWAIQNPDPPVTLANE
jgi:hypothetical protein